MSLLDKIRAAADKVQGNPDVLALRFRKPLTFTLGTSTWPDTRCSVQDPQKLKPDMLARLQATAAELSVSYRDLRVLRVHPDDTPPYPGATAPFDDGTLEVLDWSQASDFLRTSPDGGGEDGQRVATCVLRRP